MTIYIYILGFFLSLSAYGQKEFDWCFIENKGQFNTKVTYKHQLPNGALFLEKDGITYHLMSESSHSDHDDEERDMHYHAFSVDFLGANKLAKIENSQPTKHYFNYFIGPDKAKWHSKVKGYETVKYKELYPSIDFIIYDTDSKIKYDFIVRKGGNPNNIRLKYNDLSDMHIDEQGRLHLNNTVETIIEDAPYVYQNINNKIVKVEAEYVLNNNVISYHFPNGYNDHYDLVIDPTLIMSTYSGATDHFSTNCSAYDAAGNLYVAGGNRFAGFPVTAGAYQTTYQGIGADNIAIQKFAPSGALLYATYFGGEGDYPLDISVNNNNDLVILAATVGGFPVSATSAQNVYAGNIDYGIGILNSTGTTLVGATYLGGSGIEAPGTAVSDNAAGLFIHNTGAILVSGGTESADFPVSATAFQNSLNGNSDGVLAAFDNTLTNRIWSTYIGGSGDDICNSLAVGPNGNVYCVGNTNSNDFPVTAGTLNTTAIGMRDGFVAELSTTGNAIIAGTYLGTPQDDRSKFILINNANEVFVGGSTVGAYSISPGVFSSPSQNNLYVHKLNSTLTTTLFSTSIGCFNTQQPEIFMTAMGLDYCEKIYFTGASTGNNFPTTADAYSTAEKGLYMCVLEPNAAALHYGTYFGGNVNGQHFHPGSKSKYNNEGVLFHTECTQSTDYPVVNGVNTGNGNTFDGASFIFDFEFDQPIVQTNMTTPNSCTFPITLDASHPDNVNVSYLWSTGETTPTIDVNSNGEYKVQIFNFCDTIRDSVDVNVTGATVDFSVNRTDDCAGVIFTFTDNSTDVPPGAGYTWDFGDGFTSDEQNSQHVYTNTDTFTVSLTIDANGCSNTETKVDLITIRPNPTANFEFSPELVTTEEPEVQFINTSSSDVTILEWAFSGVDKSSIIQNPKIKYPDEAGQIYPVTLQVQNAYGCLAEITKYVTVQDVVTMYVPNSFTPGGNDENSLFQPVITSGVDPYNFRLLIYNRWGEIVFESYDYSKPWDGKYDNQFVQQGAYVWQIDFKENMSSKDHRIRGHVTVLR